MSRFLLLLMVGCMLVATPAAKAQEVPEAYLAEGLRNNLVLQQKNIALEQSLLALKEARSLFQPTTWLEGQYTLARGGRSIDLPVGDLLNPVYKTLNQLTGTHAFPEIANVSEQFLPNNFYDLRVRTTLPLINPDIRYNRSIKQQQTTLAEKEVDIYRRELIREIKTAYYSYQQAGNAVTIYQHALELVQQNLRVNQSLLRNGKGLPAYIARSESEVQLVTSQLQEARNNLQNAQAYFNFLLNRSLVDSIELSSTTDAELVLTLPPLLNGSIEKREELQATKIAMTISQNLDKMNRAYRTPRLNGFVDLASQGFNFEVNKRSFFYLAGLQLQVPIYTGKRNLYRIAQSGLQLKQTALLQQQTTRQLELTVTVTRNNISTAYSGYLSARKQQDAAFQYFRLIDKGYKEGINSFIELLDARTSLTNAALQTNITRYKVLTALAEYERHTAAYPIK